MTSAGVLVLAHGLRETLGYFLLLQSDMPSSEATIRLCREASIWGHIKEMPGSCARPLLRILLAGVAFLRTRYSGN